jgi:hypothetical protein
MAWNALNIRNKFEIWGGTYHHYLPLEVRTLLW